jgi:hypothetical protein
MIRQLLEQRPDSYSVLVKQYELLSTKGSASWPLPHLWRVFLGIFETLSETIAYMILDGLDECKGSSRRELLASLQSLVSRLVSQDSGSSAYILKIVISSRPDEQLPGIMILAEHLEITPPDTADTAWGMGIFIESRVW